MPKSGIMRAHKHRRYRESVSPISPAYASEIPSRGIALTDADLARVIGGTEERSDARAVFLSSDEGHVRYQLP